MKKIFTKLPSVRRGGWSGEARESARLTFVIARAADTPPSNDKIKDDERSRAIGLRSGKGLVVIPRHLNRTKR